GAAEAEGAAVVEGHDQDVVAVFLLDLPVVGRPFLGQFIGGQIAVDFAGAGGLVVAAGGREGEGAVGKGGRAVHLRPDLRDHVVHAYLDVDVLLEGTVGVEDEVLGHAPGIAGELAGLGVPVGGGRDGPLYPFADHDGRHDRGWSTVGRRRGGRCGRCFVGGTGNGNAQQGRGADGNDEDGLDDEIGAG